MEKHFPRFILPLSSGVAIQSGQELLISSRPQVSAFWPRKLVIKHADHWRVKQVYTEEGGRIVPDSCNGRHFNFDSPPSDAFCMNRPLAAAESIYFAIQRNPAWQGEAPFEACVFGAAQPDNLVRVPSRQVETARVAVACAVPEPTLRLELKVQDTDFFGEVITVDDAADWVVHDVLVDDRSLLLQSGDLPGVMFGGHANSPRLKLGHLSSGSRIALSVTYVGAGKPARFGFSVSGPKRAADRSDLAMEVLLPLSSGCSVAHNISALITARPQKSYVPEGFGFEAQRIVIRDPFQWVVNDFKVGNLSQFVQSGDVPGIAFHPEAPAGLLRAAVCPARYDFSIGVTNVGMERHFCCGAAGNLVPLHP